MKRLAWRSKLLSRSSIILHCSLPFSLSALYSSHKLVESCKPVCDIWLFMSRCFCNDIAWKWPVREKRTITHLQLSAHLIRQQPEVIQCCSRSMTQQIIFILPDANTVFFFYAINIFRFVFVLPFIYSSITLLQTCLLNFWATHNSQNS